MVCRAKAAGGATHFSLSKAICESSKGETIDGDMRPAGICHPECASHGDSSLYCDVLSEMRLGVLENKLRS